MQQTKIRNKKELKMVRSILRQTMPAPEVILWQNIRSGQLGIKFRRQFTFENYILDFFSPIANLAIEIDGDSHFEGVAAKANDRIRDENLAKHGIKVLRFTNHEIMNNLQGVVETIVASTPSLSPPYQGGERRENHQNLQTEING